MYYSHVFNLFGAIHTSHHIYILISNCSRASSLFGPVCNAVNQRLPAGSRPGNAYSLLPSRVICLCLLSDVAE